MHVGTHGSCVRSNNPALVFHSPCADARTVRPYMPRSMQLVVPVHLFIYQPRGVDARAVRPYIAIMGMLWGNGYSVCVPDAVG